MARYGGSPSSALDQHRAWLELVDAEGPFLAVPVLKDIFKSGMPNFAKEHPERFDVFGVARKVFDKAWERYDVSPGR